ncbi:unnamed protein product [Echinostoma caproni]|uniref:DUF221-domain-containing protein n=1 Tax=Echinostoma caproni TaxID=27848 RepID=A0A183A5W1_9TREM|nr:unnamed protein product [Echinostoma caproni]
MNHPLTTEPENDQALDSSQFLERNKLRDDKCHHSWTPNMEATDWSDAEEWRSKHTGNEKRFRPQRDLNSALMAIESFLILLTLISPVLIYAVPFLWMKRLIRTSERFENCRMLCEIRLLSLCVKYVILCAVILSLYAIRLRTTICCTERIHTSSSSWLRSAASNSQSTPLSKSKTALSLSESDRQNFPIYFLLDFLMSTVTFVFWVHLIVKWHVQIKGLQRTGPQRAIIAKNPFIETRTATEPERAAAASVAVVDANDFVDAHLFIQIAGLLFIKAWQNSCGTRRFLVHVVRAPDSFSHSYRIGLIDVHSAAVHVIQNLSIEPRIRDPLTAHKKQRNQNSPSVRQSTSLNEYATLDDQTSAAASDATGTGGSRRRRRLKNKHRNGFRYRSGEDQPHCDLACSADQAETELESSNYAVKESPQRTNTLYLGTIDQRELNVAAAARMNLQADYDFLLLKRQTRLKLLVGHWFQMVQSKHLMGLAKGVNSDRLDRIREASNLVFEHIGSPLFKYLRFTGQQGKYNEYNIRDRLALHLVCHMTAEAFLAPFFQPHPQLIRDPQLEYRSSGHGSDPTQPSVGCWSFFARSQQIDATANCHEAENRSINNTQSNKTKKAVFQTWKLRIRPNPVSFLNQFDTRRAECQLSINSLIHHGLRFELVRANVTLLCTVYRLPMIQLIPNTVSADWWRWWTSSTPEGRSMPTSTIETCLGSSENFMEIRL